MTDQPVLHWFRRDLRLSDNTALSAALATQAAVIPVFVLDPALLHGRRFGLPRMAFLLKALRSLDESLQRHGSALLVRSGEPVKVLYDLVRETDAKALYFNRDYSPFALRRDDELADALNVPVQMFDDLLLHAPGSVAKDDGDPYVVFTPFKRQWLSLPKPQIGAGEANGTFHNLDGIARQDIPTLADLGLSETIAVPPANETAARKRLDDFTAKPIYNYAESRNYLPLDPFADDAPVGSSYLSPHFHLGLLSPRQAYHAARAALNRTAHPAERESVQTWIDELGWREFYNHIHYHYPHVTHRSFREEYDAVAFRDAPAELQAWQDGQTGYPIIDAAMRQLKTIGWMPNRARMFVASFLTKDLLIYWQAGEHHFMHWLIDGDNAANNGGWQWAAGTGTDAQPYFRIFNPLSQSKKFDPDGSYIRHWLPELRSVPDKFIHAPWEMDDPPFDYPPPMVDHKFARERTLAAYKAIKDKE